MSLDTPHSHWKVWGRSSVSIDLAVLGFTSSAYFLEGDGAEKFVAVFRGYGTSLGAPVGATLSFRDLPSSSREIHTRSSPLRASDFNGWGAIIDVSGALLAGLSFQILLFDVPASLLLPGAGHVVDIVERSIEALGHCSPGPYAGGLVGVKSGNLGITAGVSLIGGRWEIVKRFHSPLDALNLLDPTRDVFSNPLPRRPLWQP
jgi:hypothetical protein